MPGNKMMIDVNFPSFEGKGSLEERVNALHNYVYQLMESLRYALNNLDTTNFNSTELSKFTGEITEPIYVRLEDDEGKIAEIKVTADKVESDIYDEDGKISKILQQADGITLEVTNGETSSRIVLKNNKGEIYAEDIKMTGLVSFKSLKTPGETEIDGGNIKTGTIDAVDLRLKNCFSVLDGNNAEQGFIGYGEGSDGENKTTQGIIMSGQEKKIYAIVTNEGVRLQAYDETRFYLVSNNIVATKPIDQTSDRNLKKDIAYDIDRYSEFFKELLPCSFRLKSEEDGKRYLGFIAQEVEGALKKSGLTGKEFAGLSKVKEENGNEYYVLGYTEFIALLTNELQKTQKNQKELIKRIEKLEQMQK